MKDLKGIWREQQARAKLKAEGLDPTHTWQVVASSDDCRRRLFIDSFSLDDTRHFVGDVDTLEYDNRMGVRFIDVGIPQGEIISSAYLKLKAWTKEALPADTILKGEAADNALTFSDAADYDDRVRTGASVNWTPAAWVMNTWYDSPDIKTIIQEIISRPGWVSGNALVIFWSDPVGFQTKDAIECYSFDGDPDFAPKLEVTWGVVVPKPKGTIAIHAKVLGII